MDHTDKINELIAEGETYTFKNNHFTTNHGVYSKASVKMQAWLAECEDFVIQNYGLESAPYRVYARFERKKLDGNFEDTFVRQKDIVISALAACLRLPPREQKQISLKSRELNLSKVFIVHGHDETAKIKTARFIEKLGLEPIILHEQASAGNTIIEKIEEYSNVGFGIILYTACDIGGKQTSSPLMQSRARQNVVFEHGYLMGKIGRDRVCALVKGTIETPNDISGVVYITMDESDAWHIQIAKELKRSGYLIDMNKII